MKTTIVNVGYRSTNYWVVSAGRSRVLVDLGWPGTFATLRATMGRMGVPLEELRYGLATHYHIDHAGLAQELSLAGVSLLVVDLQLPAIPALAALTKASEGFIPIDVRKATVITLEQSRMTLAKIGIDGEIVHTPGHSDDSVSLLLDDGSVFTGDLTNPALAGEGDAESEKVAASWKMLQERGARTVYPGHGPPRPI